MEKQGKRKAHSTLWPHLSLKRKKESNFDRLKGEQIHIFETLTTELLSDDEVKRHFYRLVSVLGENQEVKSVLPLQQTTLLPIFGMQNLYHPQNSMHI